ncbi:hypothetical protein [Hydrogenophaga sp.]|uniref:hypothetical protein n=1 Tax=Hydrogenophaga sp. TaxID=1904254 RepID=UPI002715D7E1|nr:hypothetical protein [Hydrogenophaga sp.]MDO9438980.1 hypothetical protein [Hydrogenophaga sp.]
MTFNNNTATTALLIARHDSIAAREIAIEHAVLTRQLASAQRRLSEQMQAHALQVLTLEAEVVQLRAQLIMARTCMFWGLSTSGVMRPLARRANLTHAAIEAAALAEASNVICQTGCVGHAHPWLAADGQCRRTGAACAQVERDMPG